jgi:hypothetical protein
MNASCRTPVNSLVVYVEPGSGMSASAIAARLAAGVPVVLVNTERDALIVCVDALWEGEETIIAERLQEALVA